MGIRIQGTLKMAGNLKTPDYYLLNTGFREQNASLALQLIQTKKHTLDYFSSYYHNKPAILLSSHIGNLTDLQKIINGELTPETGNFSYSIKRPYQNIEHWLNRAKWRWQYSPRLAFECIYGFQLNKREEFDNHNYFNSSKASLSFTLRTHQLDFVLTKTLKKNGYLKSGINGFWQTNNYTGRYFIPNYIKRELYQFSILRYKKNRHELEMGYRFGGINQDIYKWENAIIAHYPLTYHGLSWQLGWLLRINHDWQLGVQTGKVWRNPNISELFSNGLHHGTASIEYGSLTLKPEQAVSANAVLKYRHNKTLFEAEVFVKQIHNYIYLKPKLPAELTIRGAFPAFVYDQTDVRLSGIELFIEQTLWKSFSLNEKVSILNALDLKNKGYIVGIPPYSFNHSLKYKIKPGKIISLGHLTVSLQQNLKQKRYTNGSDYMAPPNGYLLLNAGFSVSLSRHKNILFFGTAENIFNKKYRNYLNRFRYFANEPGRMLTLGLNLKF